MQVREHFKIHPKRHFRIAEGVGILPQPLGSAFAMFMARVGLWMAALFAMRRESRGALPAAANP